MNKYTFNKTKQRADEGDEDDDEQSKQIGRNLFVTVKKSAQFDFHLDDAIGSKSEFRQLLQILYNASEDDVVRLFLSGPGGNLETLLAIINAINCTDAKVIGILTAQAASAHTILALAVPQLQVCPRGRFMIHSASTGTYGKLQEAVSSLESDIKICHNLFEEFYLGFLSEEEMRDLFIGKDFYFDAEEIMQRLKRRETYHKKLEKAQKDKAKKVKTKPVV